MEIQNLIKKLEQLKYPNVELVKHKSLLRTALLKKAGRFLPAQPERPVFWRQIYLLKNMSLIKKVVPIGIALVLILIAALAVYQKNSGQAQAKEVLNKAINSVNQLLPEQKIEIEEIIKDDPVSSLTEATQAKDLTMVSKKEIADDPVLKEAAGKSDDTKFIRYTNPRGQIIIIGIGHDNLPTMKDSRNNDEHRGEKENKDEEKNEALQKTATTTPSAVSPSSSPRPEKEGNKDKKRDVASPSASPTASPTKETKED